MAAQTNPHFQGWLGKTPDSVNGKMEWGDFEPKKWTEDDVDIEISHCGICGSDLHSRSRTALHRHSASSPLCSRSAEYFRIAPRPHAQVRYA